MSFIYVPSTAAPAAAIGTPVDTTSGTSVTFIAIPSSAKVIYLNFVDFSLSGADDIKIQLGTSTTIETTGYAYSNVSLTGGVSTGSSSNDTNFYWTMPGSTTLNGTIALCLENSTTNTYNMTYILGNYSNRMYMSAGRKILASALSQIKVSMYGAATFATGQLNIAYI